MEKRPNHEFISNLWTYSAIYSTVFALGSDVRWAALSFYNSENADMIQAFNWASVQILALFVIAAMNNPQDPDELNGGV